MRQLLFQLVELGLGSWMVTSHHGLLLAVGWILLVFVGLSLISLHGRNAVLVKTCATLAKRLHPDVSGVETR